MKRSFYPSLPASVLMLGTIALVGCGGAATYSNSSATATPPPAGTPAPQAVAGPPVQGTVYGGHAPLEGAHVYLLQPGTTGYGSAATSLLGTGATTSPGGFTLTANTTDPNVPVGAMFETTDSGGNFNLTGAYVCTVGQPVYIYAWGGAISATALNNANIVQLATLGNCPSSGNFSTAGNGALSAVYLNEVSTIATAYTFQPFTLAANNDAWHIGTSGTAQALLGIANAANTAAQLYDIQGGAQLSTGPADGEGHLANFQTQLNGVPNQGNGVVPQATIDTLANIISDCVDTAPAALGTETSQCSSLFKAATNNGEIGTAANEPTDTGTAVINIARFPAGNHSAGAANVDATYAKDIFALQPGTLPYVPALSNVPNDWTLAIDYPGPNNGVTGSASSEKVTNSTLNLAESIAVDDAGQLWITSQGNGATDNPDIVRWTNLGGQNSFNAFPYIPGYVSIDGGGNAWTGNANDSPGGSGGGTGTGIFEFNSNGVLTNTYGSGYYNAYVVIANQAGNAFFFASNATLTPDYGMWEYDGSGVLVAGSPFNCCGTSTTTTTTVPATATLSILAATANTGGTYTFVISPVSSTFTTPLAVGDTVSLALTNDQSVGNSPHATGWDKLTSVKVASVNNAANPTSFTATSNTTPTPATTNTVSTDTNGPVETITINQATETNTTKKGVTTFTYTFDYTPATGAPPLAVGDTVGLALTNAPAGFFGAAATGWQNLTSVTITAVGNGGTQFTATGTTPVTDSTSLFGQGNGATGTGAYNINGATGTGSFTSTTVTTTTTTTPGAIPAGQNVAHGAIDSDGDLWITTEADPSGGAGCNNGCEIARVTPAGAPLFTSIVTAEQPELPAIDHSGNAWIAIQETAAQVDVVSPTGGLTTLTSTGAGGTTATGALMTSTFGAAVDGNGNVWFANRAGNYGLVSGAAGTNTIFVLNGGVSTPGTEFQAISPPTNYVPQAQYPSNATTSTPMLDGPLNLAIDPSGNVWITNYTGGGVIELVGAAAPVVTPLSVAAGNGQLGQKP